MADERPYERWQSPVTAWDAARVPALRVVAVDAAGHVWWQETRPDEGGRVHLFRGTVRGQPLGVSVSDLAADCDGAIGTGLPVGDAMVAVRRDDHRLFLLRSGTRPLALTPEPTDAPAQRYTDLVPAPDGTEIFCVRESRRADGMTSSLVAVPLDGSQAIRTLVSPTGAVSTPRPSPDGDLLAWITWEHPQMPWDGSRLQVGRLTSQGVTETRTVLGGAVEAVFQPEWASRDSLYVASDRTRWWNLYEVWIDGTQRPLYQSAEEFGWPQTVPGPATYGRLADGRLAVLHGTGTWRLDLLDPVHGTLAPLDLPYTAWQPDLHAGGNLIAGVAGTPAHPAAVVAVDAGSGQHRVLRQSVDAPAAGYLPHCRSTGFAARDGHVVPAVVHPPRSPHRGTRTGERTPYLLFLHDGPGAQATRMLDLAKVFFTSRGFGVVEVDARGASGYGRGYREQIYGRWGVADVEDCAVVVRGLVDGWDADPARLVVRGSGAGATTALAALANTDLFAAATLFAPITHLPALTGGAQRTLSDHLREIAADSTLLRRESWLDRVRRPVLMFHGERDEVVPLAQGGLLCHALERQHTPHTCLTFANEGHRFRRADTIARVLDAELSFYASALGL